MRLGQILVEAELISPQQLTAGLEYGKAKGIFLGKALKLLKLIEDADIDRALQAQRFIRLGLSPVLAVKALMTAVKEKIPLEQGLQSTTAHASGAVCAELSVDESLSAEQLVEGGDNFLLEDECTKAEIYYLAAKDLIEKSRGKAHESLGPVLIRLGNTYLALERFEKAEEVYVEGLNLKIATLSEDSLQIAHAFESLADLHKVRADEAQAMENFLKALDVIEKHLPSQLSYYATILKKVVICSQTIAAHPLRPQPIGELLKAAGIISEAQLKGALRMSRQSQTPVGVTLRENLMIGDRELQSALKAQFCIQQGLLSEQLAIDLLSRASRRDISLERLLHEAGVLASNYDKFEAYREIATELDRLVACETSSLSSQDDVGPIVFKLGTLYEQLGDNSQAEVYYSRALKKWGDEIKGDLNAARTCTSLAKIHKSQNRHEEVLALLLKALEHKQHALGNNHEETIETMEDTAEAEIEYRDSKSAIAHLRLAIACREELGHDGAKLLRAEVLLGDGFCMLKHYKGAKTAYEKALSLAQSAYGPASFACAAVVEKLGDLYMDQDLSKTAFAQYKYALLILQGTGKGDSASTQKLEAKISSASAEKAES